MRRELTEEQFLKDIATHQMEVLRDDGVHRHLRFRRPGTGCMGFDIVTWSGYLAYTGDMGCYVFTRLEDMFQFFRRPDNSYRIDFSYWAEKCVAADRDGVMEYSPEKFEEHIRSWIARSYDGEEVPTGLVAAVESDVLPYAHDGAHAAYQAASEFDHEGFQFTDFWEADSRVYTHRFLWCCYALSWAIRTYDTARAASDKAAAKEHA